MNKINSTQLKRKTDVDTTARFQTIVDRLESVCSMIESELVEATGGRNSDRNASRNRSVSIVIPVYNEEATIGLVVSRVASLPLNSEIVIVDDCSTDRTREILAELEGIEGIKIVLKDVNEGKGAALRDGFQVATGEFVVVQDADLEYHPRDIPRLLEPLNDDQCDIVYGSRFIGEEQQDESVIHRFGNWLLTTASNLFTGVRLTDMETCYKAFRRQALDGIKIKQNRFGVEPELTAKWARRGYRFQEVPISYNARGYDEGKKIGIRDLFKAVYCICRYGLTD
jgi:glycosyltransferase involved in cell wall biosynthesis